MPGAQSKCGRSGNAIDLWDQATQQTPYDAAIDLCQRLGITLEQAMERHAADYALKRVSTDADVAHACLFLASDVSRQITGADLPIDGGWAML